MYSCNLGLQCLISTDFAASSLKIAAFTKAKNADVSKPVESRFSMGCCDPYMTSIVMSSWSRTCTLTHTDTHTHTQTHPHARTHTRTHATSQENWNIRLKYTNKVLPRLKRLSIAMVKHGCFLEAQLREH